MPEQEQIALSPEEEARRAEIRAARQRKKQQKQEQTQPAGKEHAPPLRRLLPVVGNSVPLRQPQQHDDRLRRSFTLMTYNVLAQCLCRRDLFPYCKKEHLKYKARFPILLKEITQTIKPDVACLQEVDHFDDMFAPALRAARYDWEYLQKAPEKDESHGLCVIWKKDLFQKYRYQTLHYDDSPLTHPTPITPVTGNIAQLLALKFVAPATNSSTGILIANTHLYWRPTAQYEKLRQAYVLLNNVVALRKEDLGASWPTLLCGDWNTTPHDGVYRLLTKQPLTDVQRAHLEPVPQPSVSTTPATTTSESTVPESTATSNAPRAPSPSQSTLHNPAPTSTVLDRLAALPRLYSCYSSYQQTHPSHTEDTPSWDGEPAFTTVGSWTGTLDYIFVCAPDDVDNERTGCDIGPVKLLELPKPSDLEPGLPNSDFASDHVCLMAEMHLLPSHH
ncbi:Endonuclease/exonuclease/phosphatase [Powellomyces hirtus]|nr:Endonuclease/exonuclease/phosphatase [Powellomyces hirtus]